jgi:hypothetical protein
MKNSINLGDIRSEGENMATGIVFPGRKQSEIEKFEI